MPDLNALSEQEFEDLCTGCGECCAISVLGYACPALDTETRRCTNYASRLTEQRCVQLTPEIVPDFAERNFLPPDCSYVRYMNDEAPYKLPLDQIRTRTLLPFGNAPKIMKRDYRKAEKAWLASSPRPPSY
jgi:hypothetical protein